MNIKTIIKFFICLISLIIILNCSSSTEPTPDNLLYFLDTPIITGIHVTTNEHPDGTGEVIGIPSYTVKDINVFPNPYSGIITTFSSNRELYVVFNHLPEKVTIVIIKGKSSSEAFNSHRSIMGVPIIKSDVLKVRTVEKDDVSQFSTWDFKDDDGDYVLSGYYRAYLFGERVSDGYYLDISLNLTVCLDCQ